MKKRFKNFLNNTERVDLKIIIAIIFLCAFGCMMVYSASSYICATEKSFSYDDAYMLKRQVLFIVLGLGAMLAIQYIDYHILYWMGWGTYILMGVLIVLLLTPLGQEVNGAVRWLNFKVFTIHVGEASKILLIIFLSYLMAPHMNGRRSCVNVIKVWVLTAAAAGLILVISSNLSSCLIMIMIAFTMTLIWSNTNKFHLAMAGAAAVAVAAGLIYIYMTLPDPETANTMNYQLKRILGWMAPEKYKDVFSDQILQSLYAVGSGGFFGKGLGNSIQKLTKIPEPQNDMIFAIICEELGIFGGTIVLILLGYLILQLVRVALDASDAFGGLLVTGIALHLSFQTIINVAVALNVFPNTGVSLPFISYGGSSMMLMLAEIGIVLSVRRYRVLRDFERAVKTQRIRMR